MSSGDNLGSVPSDVIVTDSVCSAATTVASSEQETIGRLESLTERVDQVAGTLTSRDAILEAVDTCVTSLAEEWRPLKQFLDVKVKEVEESSKGALVMLQSAGIDSGERVRKNSIDIMMMKTLIRYSNEGKFSRVKGFYEALYGASPLTASLFQFLHFQPRVRITIDCDTHHIGNIKVNFQDHLCRSQNSYDFYKYVNCHEQQIYLGCGLIDVTHRTVLAVTERNVIGQLALSLAEMSIYLAFKNEGRPYGEGDDEMAQLYKGIMEDAKKKQKDGVRLDTLIKCALNIHKNCNIQSYHKNIAQIKEELELVCAVPRIMAWYGQKEGRRILREQLPSLLDYYTDHVMTRLSRETEVLESTGEMSSGDKHGNVPSDVVVTDSVRCSDEVTAPTVTSSEQETIGRLESLTERVDQMASTLTSRDAILEAMQTSVISLAEEWRPLKQFIDAKVKLVEESKMNDLEMLQSFGIDSCKSTRKNCIDFMIIKTIIRNWNEEKFSRVKGFYEELYDASPLAASLFQFLQFQPRVRITIDCDAHHIGNIKEKFNDHLGHPQEGENFYKYVDCHEQHIYLGCGLVDVTHRTVLAVTEMDVIGQLALSLAEMSIFVAFKNVGRPYCKGDNEMAQLCNSIVEDAKKKQKDGVRLDPIIECALNIHNKWYDPYYNITVQIKKELELVCAVPRIMAWYRQKEGERILREQLPSLLDYYTDHVMARLSRETEAARST